jgi:hypothetical protein
MNIVLFGQLIYFRVEFTLVHRSTLNLSRGEMCINQSVIVALTNSGIIILCKMGMFEPSLRFLQVHPHIMYRYFGESPVDIQAQVCMANQQYWVDKGTTT